MFRCFQTAEVDEMSVHTATLRLPKMVKFHVTAIASDWESSCHAGSICHDTSILPVHAFPPTLLARALDIYWNGMPPIEEFRALLYKAGVAEACVFPTERIGAIGAGCSGSHQ